ncbi:UNVERIFIED_CONTAM: Cation/calcium exchanger 1 [Sesamum angustifolium]|uniref:Cation/calcium exchanger 1 n=1 Tax=Sesamum angustifolium TaxID=2727405 RepID=A0AAW2PW64_9LAMI
MPSLFLNLSFLFLLSLYIISKNPTSIHLMKNSTDDDQGGSTATCSGVRELVGGRSKCAYVKSHSSCWGKGYLNYLQIFYCSFMNMPAVGYSVLLLWLAVLFYVLGNTTSHYFCPSVESLSRVMELSPTIAGTTLLPLGNGANDVFSSVISFTRAGDADVGLNSVLGGAFFISCFVVGIVSISISSRGIRVDKNSFIRDVLFFVLVLCCLLVIVAYGKINLWFALCFLAVYFLYIAVVSVMHMFCHKEELVVVSSVLDEFGAVGIPLLLNVDEEKGLESEKGCDHKAQEQESGGG